MSRNDFLNDHDIVQYASRAPSGEECSDASYSRSESVKEPVCHGDVCELPRKQQPLRAAYEDVREGSGEERSGKMSREQSYKVSKSQSQKSHEGCKDCQGCQKQPCQCERCLRIAIHQLKETLNFCKYNRRLYRRQAKDRKGRYENEFAGPYGNFYDFSGSGNYFNPNWCPRGFTGVYPQRKCGC